MAATMRPQLESAVDGLLRGGRAFEFWTPRVLALLASGIGPLPLVLDLKFHAAMSATPPVLWPLSAILVAASVLLARRGGGRAFVKAVLVALLAGFMATGTSDSTRVAAMSAGITEMDEALDFGGRLTGQTGPGHGSGHGDDSRPAAVSQHVEADAAPAAQGSIAHDEPRGSAHQAPPAHMSHAGVGLTLGVVAWALLGREHDRS